MTLTWNILAKDLMRMRAAILAWAGVMALKILFYAGVSGAFGSPNLPWLVRLGQEPVPLIRGCIEPLIAFVLVGWMVYEDPLAGSDAFWVTRPISGARLLGAKALGAVLLFVVLPILVNLPWWLSCGFGPAQVARAAVPMAAEYGSVVVIGMGVASATTSFPRYFLWTIAGFAGLLAVHLAAEIAKSGMDFQSTQNLGTGLALTRVVVLFVCALVVCAEIGAFQFLSGHFRWSLPVTVALTVALSAIAFSSRLNFFPHFGWQAQKTPETGEAAPNEVDVSVPATLPRFDGLLTVPMRITGLAPGMAAFWQTQAEWSDGGQSIWKTSGFAGRAQDDLMQSKVRSLVGFAPDVSNFTSVINFQFPRSLAQKYADKSLSFHAKVYIYLLKGAIAADEPLAAQNFRSPGSSYSVTDIDKGEHVVTLTVTDRFERPDFLAFFGVVWPRSTSWALVNRDKAEMNVGIDLLGSNLLGLQLNMVSVVSQRIAFAVTASPSWLEGARLVAFEFSGDHNVERSLVEEPFRYTYLSPEDSKYRLRKGH